MTVKKIILYSQPGCESCVMIKHLLEKTELTYKEINVFEHREMWEGIRQGESGVMYTPTFGVQFPKEQKIIYISAGRDFDKEEEGIEKLKILV